MRLSSKEQLSISFIFALRNKTLKLNQKIYEKLQHQNIFPNNNADVQQ